MSQMPLFTSAQAPLTVIEVTRRVRALLEGDETLQDLWVQGEVSNLSRPKSGHLYFTLKDAESALPCVMWRNQVERLTYLPRDGEAVEAHGSVSVYEAGGRYQLYADMLRPAGEGALYQEFLRLKAELEAEGLFDPERKRPIPAWPGRIGIVTSPTGAAIRDMLDTLRRRFPLAEVVLVPSAVQGEGAPAEIVAALERLNRLARPDVILLARGGGSIEDLWAFNDERVARAVAASEAPVVSGVGHETDFTIADFVADLRAPTPTAAAELAAPDLAEVRGVLAERALALGRAAQSAIGDRRWAFAELSGRLRLLSPAARLRSDRQRVDELGRRLEAILAHRAQLLRARLGGAEQKLAALAPLGVLGRGFAFVSHTDGRPVRSVQDVRSGDPLDVRVSDGGFGVEVTGDKRGSSP